MASNSMAAFYPSLSSTSRPMFSQSLLLDGPGDMDTHFNSLFVGSADHRLETVRGNSFLFWPPAFPMVIPVEDLVAAGFYYTGEGETVACYSCEVEVPKWKDGDVPLEIHRRLSPHCHHIQLVDQRSKVTKPNNHGSQKRSQTNNDKRNITSNSLLGNQSTCDNYVKMSLSGMDINGFWPQGANNTHEADNLKHRENRLKTFTQPCPTSLLEQKIPFAYAGFFYTGRSDVVQCSFCNGILHASKIGRDVQASHVKFFPNCSFIKKQISSKIDTVESTTFSSDTGHLQNLRTENAELRKSVTCKLCHIKPVQILTLPCSHIVCCEECAETVDNCPQCEERIFGTVKIFMA